MQLSGGAIFQTALVNCRQAAADKAVGESERNSAVALRRTPDCQKKLKVIKQVSIEGKRTI
jgi:hypothetical protein